ncbi:DUF4097 family beta strand repeat-containing protein [Spirillospora sp. CA-255316]
MEWDEANARLTVCVPNIDGLSVVGVGNLDVVGVDASVVLGNSVGGDLIVNGTRVGAGTNVSVGHLEITVAVPEDSALVAVTRAASVEAHGEYTAVRFTSTSGDLSVGGTQLLWANTVSGSVYAEAVDGYAVVGSVSGSIRIRRTDNIKARSTSGRVAVEDLGGIADLETTSGAIDVYATEGARVRARSVSGRIRVDASPTALAEGLDVDAISRSGRVRTPDIGVPATSRARQPRRGGAR